MQFARTAAKRGPDLFHTRMRSDTEDHVIVLLHVASVITARDRGAGAINPPSSTRNYRPLPRKRTPALFDALAEFKCVPVPFTPTDWQTPPLGNLHLDGFRPG